MIKQQLDPTAGDFRQQIFPSIHHDHIQSQSFTSKRFIPSTETQRNLHWLSYHRRDRLGPFVPLARLPTRDHSANSATATVTASGFKGQPLLVVKNLERVRYFYQGGQESLKKMSLNDITTLIKIVKELASIIQREGDSWYRCSPELEKFKSNVADFERNCDAWQRRAGRYGLLSEQTFLESLKEAIRLLEKEKAKLKHLERRGGSWCLFGCLLAICGTPFPSQLGESIQKLLDETIPSKWKAEEAGDAAAEERVKISARRESFRFRRDPRYVRLPIIEQEIKDALENKGAANESVRAVLLEGPAGTGKTCMARNLSLDYLEEKGRTFSLPESSKSTIPDQGSTFDHVFYLECGEKLNTLAKHIELLKLLGWKEPLEQQEVQVTNQDMAKQVKGILKHLLQESNVLIILDDVWHGEFLEDLTSLCGDRVRVLVTSQRSRLCDDSFVEGLVSISMDRITTEDAQLILQLHAGFSFTDYIVKPIQECIMELVSRVSTNPHALASVATAIDRRRPGQLSEWQNAISEYDDLLSSANAKIMKFHGMPYSSSIGMKFTRLNEEERKLMALMAMLEGPSVLETVIQLFHNEMMVQREFESHRSCTIFSNCRRQLEDLQCVKVTEVDGQLSWSIHFLDRRFAQETMARDIQSIFQKFQSLPRRIQGLEIEPQEHFAKVLGALYLRNEWADQIIEALRFSTREMQFNVIRKNSIQSIIFLMMKNVSKDWSLSERASADQVFLSYVCQGIVHEEAVRILLKSKVSEQLRKSVLLDIVKVSDTSLSEEVIMDLLQVFGELRILEKNQNALDINLEQCQVLCSLAEAAGEYGNSHLIRLSICKITKIVLGLVEILRSKDKQFVFRGQSILTLGWLGCSISPHANEDRVALLVETPMLVRELIHVLEDDTCGSLQADSMKTLGRFAYFSKDNSTVKRQISSLGSEQLVRSLGQKSNKRLQEWAAHALAQLAEDSRENCLEILNYPNAMTYFLDIVGSRSRNSDFDAVREKAVSALRRIMAGIFPSPEADVGMVEGVSKCLARLWAENRYISSGLEKQAAATLTWIDPTKAKSLQLLSARAYRERGLTLVRLGQYEDGVNDLEKALRLGDGKDWKTLRRLMHPKARLGDWDAALKYADRAVELAYDSAEAFNWDHQFVLQERGVLKRMMGDLDGALKDLDNSLKVISDDYEVLKQRAYVKFLLHDVVGAQEDAEKALPLKPSKYDKPLYDNNCLGTSTVEFMNFRL